MVCRKIFLLVFPVLAASGFTLNGRIVNGTTAKPGEVPLIVSLRLADIHLCGASILTRTHLLTAAHCVQNVQFGLTHITSGEDSPNVIKVSRLIPHENYTPGDGYVNDVALVELETPLIFDLNAQPTKLPDLFDATPEYAPALLAGWGYPYSYGEIIEDLQKVEVYVYPDAECERVHALTGPTNRSCHLCAGVPGGGKGQCSGDSGGPLMVDGVQVGIVSWSVKPCTVKGYPGVFTKVSSYVDWIREKLHMVE
ncbi:chymotrypsin-1-like isoform X2 [Zophobas morio]|uniref:chymotrypsin-1-like isoform X2 n=1 Tax=Zophobas morio TaxID=2755281 RepID=UPI0030839F8B